MFIITDHIEAQSQQLSKNMTLFSKYTGIKIKWIPFHSPLNSTFYCEKCPIGCTLKNNDIQSLHAVVGLTYFCPNGFCFLSVPVASENKTTGYYLSEPINFKKTVQQNAKSFLTMSLSQISMASRLLFELTVAKRTLLPTDSLFNRLSICILESNPEKAQSILEHTIEELMIAADGDFQLVKIYTNRFILMLYELMEENSNVIKSSESEKFPGYLLSFASTLGELKTCLDGVTQECMHRLFPSALYRHYLLLQKATLMIRQNYHQKLSQNAVASSVYLSPSYFSKVFKEAFGCTFNQYLNTVRITKAKELLRYSSVSIESIPAMVGFENRSYFGKIFKQLTGRTPKQYRNSSCNETRIN